MASFKLTQPHGEREQTIVLEIAQVHDYCFSPWPSFATSKSNILNRILTFKLLVHIVNLLMVPGELFNTPSCKFFLISRNLQNNLLVSEYFEFYFIDLRVLALVWK